MNKYRKFFIVSADRCIGAVESFKLSRDHAFAARDLLAEKYGCSGVVLRGDIAVSLTYKDKPKDLSGFTLPKKDGGYWKITPKGNTIIGKKAKQLMDDYALKQDQWQWSVERSLGIYCSVFDHFPTIGFHMTVARIIEGGEVLVSAPKNLKSLSKIYPLNAVEISEERFEDLQRGAV